MRPFGKPSAFVLSRPGTFALQTLKAFRANQGLLLAGAVAYYALLSIVPLLILFVIALSHLIDQRDVIGWVLGVTMIFFSSLAFTVLENAMSVIFTHRVAIRRRHFAISALMPYLYILSLGVGLLLVTLVA